MRTNPHIVQVFRGNKIPALMVLTMAFFNSCIDEYFPELGQKYDKILVVDGMITNESPPYTVKLSYSTQLERPVYIPASGFSVQLIDMLGNIEYLQETNEGIYESSATGMQGVAGNAYRIEITSPDGTTYVSAFETMDIPVEIDTLYTETEYHEDPEYSYPIEGLRFFVDTKTIHNDSSYLLWKLEGTYKYTANYYIKYVFDGQLKPFEHYDSLYTCWHTYNVGEIFTQQTAILSEPHLVRFPLHFVNTQDKKLSIRYSLLARQIMISREAFTYWDDLNRQNSNAGSLFPTQPHQIQGNVRNSMDDGEVVLGYFMAGAVSSKRVFVDRPTELNFYYMTECPLITEDIMTLLWLWRDQWPLYLPAVYYGVGQGPAVPGSQTCTDCTASGGTLIPPEFWTE